MRYHTENTWAAVLITRAAESYTRGELTKSRCPFYLVPGCSGATARHGNSCSCREHGKAPAWHRGGLPAVRRRSSNSFVSQLRIWAIGEPSSVARRHQLGCSSRYCADRSLPTICSCLLLFSYVPCSFLRYSWIACSLKPGPPGNPPSSDTKAGAQTIRYQERTGAVF